MEMEINKLAPICQHPKPNLTIHKVGLSLSLSWLLSVGPQAIASVPWPPTLVRYTGLSRIQPNDNEEAIKPTQICLTGLTTVQCIQWWKAFTLTLSQSRYEEASPLLVGSFGRFYWNRRAFNWAAASNDSYLHYSSPAAS